MKTDVYPGKEWARSGYNPERAAFEGKYVVAEPVGGACKSVKSMRNIELVGTYISNPRLDHPARSTPWGKSIVRLFHASVGSNYQLI